LHLVGDLFEFFVLRLGFLTSAVYVIGVDTFESDLFIIVIIIVIIIIIKTYKLRITTGIFTNIVTDVK
jgi:hypothetical protein